MNDLKTYYLLNTDLTKVELIETYESMIWTDRYWEAGDFELYLPANADSMSLYTKAANEGWYILKDGDDLPATQKSVMIITNVKSETNVESGNHLSITGSSLKSILGRRIVAVNPQIAGNVQDELRRIVTENAISPTDGARAIPNLDLGDICYEYRAIHDITGNENPKALGWYIRSGVSFVLAQEESVIYGRVYYNQVNAIEDIVNYDAEGLQLDAAITNICKIYKLGWDVVYDMTTNLFKFIITKGVDRTSNQTVAQNERNPYVIFSDDYENLLTTDYRLNNSNYRNICYVKGELTLYDEEKKENYTENVTQVVTPKNVETVQYIGLNRRELFVDGTSSASNYKDYPGTYMYALRAKGQAELEKYTATTDITGKVLSNYTFDINHDYFLGDLVSAVNCYGQWFDARVTEVIHTEETRGITTIPSFVVENYADKKKDAENPDPAKMRYTEDDLIRVTEQGAIRYIEYGYREENRTCLVEDPVTHRLIEAVRETEDGETRTVYVVDKPRNE